MYYGGGNATNSGNDESVLNPENMPVPFPFVTAYLRGRTDGFMLKGGDATKGTLTTMYDGTRPFVTKNGTTRNYQPMKKQGAIILATGESFTASFTYPIGILYFTYSPFPTPPPSIGGDQSNSAMGCFYEGYMTTGDTTDVTDDAVQANIVAVAYGS